MYIYFKLKTFNIKTTTKFQFSNYYKIIIRLFTYKKKLRINNFKNTLIC